MTGLLGFGRLRGRAPIVLLVVALAGIFAPALMCRPAGAQEDAAAPRTVPITGDRLSGFVLPIEPLAGDVTLEAFTGRAWTVDDTKRLLLEQDVAITVGGHRFTADRALVWINRLPSAGGLISQIAMFLSEAKSPNSPAGMGVTGKDLLITASARGEVTLRVSLLDRRRAERDEFLRLGEARLADHLKRLLAEEQRLRRYPQVTAQKPPRPFRPVPGGYPPEVEPDLPGRILLPPEEQPTPWLREPDSFVRFGAERIELVPGGDENTITAMGSIVVEYVSRDRTEDFRRLTLSAERAVIFTDPGQLEEIARGELDTSSVRGIYLEGNVIASADGGEYVVRAPKIYYDFDTGRAVMLSAVLRTYERGGRLPVYARAAEMRQLAENQWEAEQVRISASEFYTGHLALGAERVTVTRRPSAIARDEAEMHLDARGITLRAGGGPFFYWPAFKGTLRSIPLKSVAIGTADNDGVRIQTRWNPFPLLGMETPEGVDADLKVDGFTKRGAAVGLELDYDVALGEGLIDLYGLLDDGTDRTSEGREVDYDNAFRGVALWEHRRRLSRYWNLQAQLSYVSDPTFISAWREEDFRERREYETSLYLKYQKDRAALTLLAKHELNDFISNDYLLASRQVQVDRVPEITYRRYGDPIFEDVTYSGETRVSRVRFVFEESTPRELGVRSGAFAIDEDEPVSDLLRSRGLREKYVGRFDTRHELSRPTQWGIFRINPFVAGRLTAYDEDFDTYSSDSDSTRIFGSAGLRVSTRFQRVFNDVQNRLLDLHRLRHIVEPSVTLWYGYANVDQTDLPVYDPAVESLASGGVVRLGVRNVFQTQRGGPGRWRSVDWLTLDTDLVVHSGDAEKESPTPRFFDYRPEYSQPGDHVRASMIWLLSDAFSVVGDGVYDLDASAIARGSIGAELRHSPLLTSFAEFRYIDISDNALLDIGWRYRLTPKYRIVLNPQWDIREDEFRAITLRVTRSFPDFDFTVQVRHDEIRDDTSFGASMDLVTF